MSDIKDEKTIEEKKKIMGDELLEMIMRQTNYTKEEALKKLKFWNYNFIYVMKEYLNPNFLKKKEKSKKSLNQRLMKEIRHFCENGQKTYDLRKKGVAPLNK